MESFWTTAAMQLLDQQASAQQQIAALHTTLARSPIETLPSQPVAETLLSSLSAIRATLAETQVNQPVYEREPAPGVTKCGTLRKLSGRSLSLLVNTRWVVLQGSTLSYYGDASEGKLKGILQLQGARAAPVRRQRAQIHKGFAFEVTASQSHEAGADDVPGTAGITHSIPGSAASAASAASAVAAAAGNDSNNKARLQEDPLNPLHRSKKRYVWLADTPEERDEWVRAILRAARAASAERACAEWARRFGGVHSTGEYRAQLHAFAAAHLLIVGAASAPVSASAIGASPGTASASSLHASSGVPKPPRLVLSADWVRVQMSAATRRGAGPPVPLDSSDIGGGALRRGATGVRDSLRLAAAAVATPFARLQQLRPRSSSFANPLGSAATSAASSFPGGDRETRGSSGPGSGASPAAPGLGIGVDTATAGTYNADDASPLSAVARTNRKVARALHKREVRATEAARRAAVAAAATPPGGDPDADAQRLAAEAAQAEHLSEHLRAALAAVAAGEARRRGGHVPGDRVTPRQLERDLVRDVITIDGSPVTQGSGPSLMVEAIVAALCRAARRMGDPASSGTASGRAIRDGGALTLPPLLAGQEARLLSFSRDLLLSSSRTTLGGDTYDAVELLFRCPGKVLIVPDSGGPAGPPPIRIDVVYLTAHGTRRPVDERGGSAGGSGGPSAVASHALSIMGAYGGGGGGPGRPSAATTLSDFTGTSEDAAGGFIADDGSGGALMSAYTDDEDDGGGSFDEGSDIESLAGGTGGANDDAGAVSSFHLHSRGSSASSDVDDSEHVPLVHARGGSDARAVETLTGPPLTSSVPPAAGSAALSAGGIGHSPLMEPVSPQPPPPMQPMATIATTTAAPLFTNHGHAMSGSADGSSGASQHRRWASSPASLDALTPDVTIGGGIASAAGGASASQHANGSLHQGKSQTLKPGPGLPPSSGLSQLRAQSFRERASTDTGPSGRIAVGAPPVGSAAQTPFIHSRLAVRVRASMSYRLLASDFDSDETSEDSGGSELGSVNAHYERIVRWGGLPEAATIALDVQPAASQEA